MITKEILRKLEPSANSLKLHSWRFLGMALVACLFVFMTPTQRLLAKQIVPSSHRPRSYPTNSIKLNLVFSKSVYYVGEPVCILAYLENISDKKYYVGHNLSRFNFFNVFHFIELRTYDEKGRNVQGQIVFTHPDVSVLSVSVMEKLAQYYLLLEPGKIYGIKSCGTMMRKPGRYRYVAIYREVAAQSWQEERGKLPFPVWTKKLTSQAVTIIVHQRQKKRE